MGHLWLRTTLSRTRNALPCLPTRFPHRKILPPPLQGGDACASLRRLFHSSHCSPEPSPPFSRSPLPPPPSSYSPSAGFCVSATPARNPAEKPKSKKSLKKSRVDFTKIEPSLLPTVILVGRPNVGKSALFNRLIRRREALVYNTPGDHVTRDIREGVAKLGDLRFRVLDSAGLETAAISGSILSRTATMTGNVLARSQFAIFLIDVRDGLQPLDLEVGQWMRKHASGIHTIVAMNKSESLDERGLLTAAAGEAHALGFGDPIAISAETGLGMAELYEILRPLFEDYVLRLPSGLTCTCKPYYECSV